MEMEIIEILFALTDHDDDRELYVALSLPSDSVVLFQRIYIAHADMRFGRRSGSPFVIGTKRSDNNVIKIVERTSLQAAIGLEWVCS